MKKCLSPYLRLALGFTLVELLVTVSIAAILIAVGVPSFTSIVAASNTDSATRRLSTAFSYARSDAVSRAGSVTVCASADALNCGNAAAWSQGWLVFRDENEDGTIDADDEIISVENISSLQVAIGQLDNNNNALGVSTVCFNSLGNECDANVDFVIFTATSIANGNSSAIALRSSGVVSLCEVEPNEENVLDENGDIVQDENGDAQIAVKARCT